MTTRASWTRRLQVCAVAVMVVVVVLWAVAPACVCWWLRSRLPWRLPLHQDSGEVLITTIATADPGAGLGASPSRPDLVVEASPQAMRGMLEVFSRWWIPPGLVRVGQTATGSCSLPELTTGVHTWRVTATARDDTPAVSLSITSQELNVFLAAYAQTRFEVHGHFFGLCRYQVDSATIEDDGTRVEMQCGQKITLRGRVIVETKGTQTILEVRRLVGTAHWQLVPGADGTSLTCRIHIEHVDTNDEQAGMLAVFKSLLFSELEIVINTSLARSLDKIVIPDGVPHTLAVQAQILPSPTHAPIPTQPL